MVDKDRTSILDGEVDRVLSDLLAQAEKEQISPRLRALAKKLEVALEDARKGRSGYLR